MNPTRQLRLATGLLAMAATFPLGPSLAQEAQTQTTAPVTTPVEITAPPAPTIAAETNTEAPPIVNVPPVEASEAADTSPQTASDQVPATRPRATDRPAARARPAAPLAAVAPRRAPAPLPSAAADPRVPESSPPGETAPPPAPAAELPVTTQPAEAAEAAPADPAPPPQEGKDDGASPLLLLAILAGAAAAASLLFLRWRRRRLEAAAYEDGPAYDAPVVHAEPEPPLGSPMIAAAAAHAAAPAAPSGRPWIDLLLRPVRAGVSEDDARVEFELCVDNKGSARAEDVRVSTFMLAAGSTQASEAERMLIEPPAEAYLPAPINAGDAKRIAAAVALPRDELQGSILPIVVANARYRLPDGSEGRTSVSFAVGVPWAGDLAHFDVENPSGLHEGVEARQQGEPHRV